MTKLAYLMGYGLRGEALKRQVCLCVLCVPVRAFVRAPLSVPVCSCTCACVWMCLCLCLLASVHAHSHAHTLTLSLTDGD